jgi:hypothetical protein
MARRKNTKFIDPRYFMDEKMERLDEGPFRAVRDAAAFVGRGLTPGGMTATDEAAYQNMRDAAERVSAGGREFQAFSIFSGTQSQDYLHGLPPDQILALMLASGWRGPKEDSETNRIVDMLGIQIVADLKNAVRALMNKGLKKESFSRNVLRAYGAWN